MKKIKQGRDAWVNNLNYIATTSTVTTIRTAEWLKFFALYRDATISTYSA
jgi:hypothetical protein